MLRLHFRQRTRTIVSMTICTVPILPMIFVTVRHATLQAIDERQLDHVLDLVLPYMLLSLVASCVVCGLLRYLFVSLRASHIAPQARVRLENLAIGILFSVAAINAAVFSGLAYAYEIEPYFPLEPYYPGLTGIGLGFALGLAALLINVSFKGTETPINPGTR